MKKIIASTVLPLMGLGLYAVPAMADIENSPVVVKNTNTAVVENVVLVSANTGKNVSNGGMAGKGGKGGSVSYSDHDNTGGNGGNGGDAGMGGTIVTGDAGALATIENQLNHNDTEIGNCGCDTTGTSSSDVNLQDSKTKVKNDNSAGASNLVAVDADTGTNTTNGGDAGKGGKGGSIDNSDHGNVGGNGGHAGMGGAGGSITTGMNTSIASVINVLNTNITRIHR